MANLASRDLVMTTDSGEEIAVAHYDHQPGWTDAAEDKAIMLCTVNRVLIKNRFILGRVGPSGLMIIMCDGDLFPAVRGHDQIP